MTPIHLAARYGFTQSVERLKDKYDSPIDYIETSEDGRNPIHFAAMNGHLEKVKVLAKFWQSLQMFQMHQLIMEQFLSTLLLSKAIWK